MSLGLCLAIVIVTIESVEREILRVRDGQFGMGRMGEVDVRL